MTSKSANRSLARISFLGTALLGPQYRPTEDLIEIDVTYECNLKCVGCNRSCRQAPDETRLSPAQLQKFIDETISTGRKWKRIRVLGGEPTTHPEIVQILWMLADYKTECNPDVFLEVVTNGLWEGLHSLIRAFPLSVAVTNTHKASATSNKFESFNLAPKDDYHQAFTDFRNGCWIMEECGLGLTPYGYYPCAVAGGIDRVIGLNIGLKHLPSEAQDGHTLTTQQRSLCQWCGHFRSREKLHTKDRPIASEPLYSLSWVKAYGSYSEQKPKLSLY